jgi:hypothetical protein
MAQKRFISAINCKPTSSTQKYLATQIRLAYAEMPDSVPDCVV